MNDLRWRFLQRSEFEGRSYGNSALYATPQSLGSLVRETGQNSLDAGDGEPVTMRYTIFDLSTRDARYDAFLEAIRWNVLRDHITAAANGIRSQTAVRLAAALNHLKGGESLRLLRVEDFGCVGLEGHEFGPRGSFSALIRDVENSEKGETAGGSFGLGAKTLWSCSKLLTVIFSSVVKGDEERGVRLIGKSELGFHHIAGAAEFGYKGDGFFGHPVGSDGAESMWLPSSDPRILSLFLNRVPPDGETRRHGTSALIVGFNDPTSDEETSSNVFDRLDKHVAENFWPALVKGQLKVVTELYVGDELEPNRRGQVDPAAHVPSFVDAFRKHLQNQVEPELKVPGDVVSVPVNLVVPATKPEAPIDPKHDELSAECRLVIRLAEVDCPDKRLVDSVALTRGRAMIVRYQKQGLSAGARSFHAVVVAGTLAGDGANEHHAERFLRYSEPPAHDAWKFWSGVGDRYKRGVGKRLQDLFTAVVEKLDEYLAAAPKSTDEGPEILQKLFRMPKSRPAERARWKLQDPVVSFEDGKVKVRARVWMAEATPSVVAPKLAIATESGRAHPLPWTSLSSKDAETDGLELLTDGSRKTISFEGEAPFDMTGIPPDRSAIKLAVGYRRRKGQ